MVQIRFLSDKEIKVKEKLQKGSQKYIYIYIYRREVNGLQTGSRTDAADSTALVIVQPGHERASARVCQKLAATLICTAVFVTAQRSRGRVKSPSCFMGNP